MCCIVDIHIQDELISKETSLGLFSEFRFYLNIRSLRILSHTAIATVNAEALS